MLNRYLWAMDESAITAALTRCCRFILSLRAAIRAKEGAAALERLKGEDRAAGGRTTCGPISPPRWSS